ncbi:MAG: chemotaxis protein CheB [Verrucomicrobia bacterium]|nr:MAG: chemotaxis protein CheB [Verrucomicrobiota bacterium]
MRKVVVIGGSTGAIDAFCNLLKQLPQDFSAPIMAVIHIGEGASVLPDILQRCTKLKVVSPAGSEPIAEGTVFVAPANRHLLARDGCVLSTHGPRENRHRPAIDTLFRSVARNYRSKVIAVILSGALDDGVAGCLAVEARGGTIIVQDPATAQNPEMPSNVLRAVSANYRASLEEIARLLSKLSKEGEPGPEKTPEPAECAGLEEEDGFPTTEPFAQTCPECGGSLLKVEHGDTEQWRCNVGHFYTLESFSLAHSNALERALWVALQRLNEQRSLQDHLAKRSTNTFMQRRYQENAAAAAEDMRLLKEILARL